MIPAFCLYVHPTHAWCPQRSEENTGSPVTVVTEGNKPSRGCWGWNPGPLQERRVLLTSQPFLQPQLAAVLIGILNVKRVLGDVHCVCKSFIKAV